MTFFDATYEPLRRYAYGVLGAAITVLLIYGIIDAEQAAVWAAAGASVLMVPFVEVARSKVRPLAEPREEVPFELGTEAL